MRDESQLVPRHGMQDLVRVVGVAKMDDVSLQIHPVEPVLCLILFHIKLFRTQILAQVPGFPAGEPGGR